MCEIDTKIVMRSFPGYNLNFYLVNIYTNVKYSKASRKGGKKEKKEKKQTLMRKNFDFFF
jgi:hypothetical protein